MLAVFVIHFLNVNTVPFGFAIRLSSINTVPVLSIEENGNVMIFFTIMITPLAS